MRAIVSLHIDMPDDESALDFQQAMESVRFTCALVGLHVRVGRIEYVNGNMQPRRPPKVNCFPPKGVPS